MFQPTSVCIKYHLCVGKFTDHYIVLLLQELLAKGNQWTKEMEMRLTDTDVVLLDGETQVNIEIITLSTCVRPMLGHTSVYPV